MMTEATFIQKYKSVLSAIGLEAFATDALASSFFTLTERMLTVNEYMNLTAITDVDEIILKHYADSLTVSSRIPEGSSLIDVGCGAGFPSLVLAVARPDLRITALDSTAKRINYIKETAQMLGLDNIICISARAEELAHDMHYREKFDVACARAVARLNVLSELCIPYVRPGGRFIAMKANADEEMAEARSAIETLGGHLADADRFCLSSESGNDDPRCIITVKKVASTRNIYPRNNSQIKKKPL